MTTKTFTFTYQVPTVKITKEDIIKIENEIAKAEEKAEANLLSTFNLIERIEKLIYNNFNIEEAGKKIEKISLAQTVTSNSKQYYSTATVLELYFYKNGKLKKIEAHRRNLDNRRCYHGYNVSLVEYYS